MLYACLVLFLLQLPTQVLSSQQYFFDPGLRSTTLNFQLETDISKTKVLHNFKHQKGKNTVTVSNLKDEGVYSLLVQNRNGSYIDDLWLYYVMPSWLCPFTYEKYFLDPLPTSYYPGRTAVVGCTVLGTDPKIVWERFNNSIQTWESLDELGVFNQGNDTRYYVTGLGHLYITDFRERDQGRYRCIASNSCGYRCPADEKCSGKPVIPPAVNLTIATDNEPRIGAYFLNSVIDHCWDTEGIYYKGSDSHSCSGKRPIHGHISTFNQYTSLNSTPHLEGFFDFARPTGNDSVDGSRIGKVLWTAKTINFSNFGLLEKTQDMSGKSGMCIGRIMGFAKENMQEYYYCTGFDAVTQLLLKSLRFEFVLKEAPFVTLPHGVPGVNIGRMMTVTYGQPVKIIFRIAVRISTFEKNKVKDRWLCLFNGVNTANSWHKRCDFNASESELVQFTIDYAVQGDSGYYQVLAGNDEGWAIGPPILLIVNGSVPKNGRYDLKQMDVDVDRITVMWNRPNVEMAGANNYTVTVENKVWEQTTEVLYEREGKEYLTIGGLDPGVLYAITVTLDGGLVADTKTIRTLPVRTEAKVQLLCKSNASEIFCHWPKPDLSSWHSARLEYRIRYWETNDKKDVLSPEFLKRVQDLEVRLDRLKPFTSYRVEISACNEEGCADEETKTFQTDEETPDEVQFLRDPWPSTNTIQVELIFPSVLPGNLETEVVRFEEKDYINLLENGKVGQVNITFSNTSESNHQRHLFKQPKFQITGLADSTTYYIKFRWKTGAGDGPFTPFFRIQTTRYINYKLIVSICGVILFLIIIIGSCTIYVRRRWPGLFKYVLEKMREFFERSIYLTPQEPADFQEDDPNITYDFDGPGVVFCIQK